MQAELAHNEEQLRRAVLILWRTNMLRQTRLTVIDEVVNGLSYYDYTFFRELPRLYATIEDALAKLDPRRPEKPIPSFLRVGSWIGGDRDGNPYVTASVLNEATRLQSARALNHYLDELHRARRRVFARRQPGAGQRRIERARGPGERPFPQSARRALSSRHHRHVFAPRQDRAATSIMSWRCAIR